MELVIEVLNSGFLSSIQDLGRDGWTHLGISPGGAADPQALKIGNRLLGNEDSAAAIEMTIVGGNFRFHEDTWVALTGSDCEPRVDGIPMAMWYSFRVGKGQTLSTGSIGPGARAYLCVHGGIEVPELLGSRSTFLSGKWGGLEGRPLASGDRLATGGQIARSAGSRRAGLLLRMLYQGDTVVRVTRGIQWDWFTEEAQRRFFETPFAVTTEADRKGLRLDGPALALLEPKELLTEGVSNGAIQVPSSGQPLLLFCEQRTTGGYPKIANVIRADLYRIGQLKPGDKVSFQEVSLEDAWRIHREREEQCRTLLI